MDDSVEAKVARIEEHTMGETAQISARLMVSFLHKGVVLV